MKIRKVAEEGNCIVKLVKFSSTELKANYQDLIYNLLKECSNRKKINVFYTNIQNWWVDLKNRIVSNIPWVEEAWFVYRKAWKIYFRLVVKWY